MTPKSRRRGKLHIGCGPERLDGWVNIDILDLPSVDVVADVTEGLRFRDVEAVFAEHFLEHLAIEDALRFLQEVHRALADGAWLRLSTPNLDWVWVTHYRLDAPPMEKPEMALRTNRAFRGWGHRFLWNREILSQALEACGFSELRWCRYGASELEVFRRLERHETWEDDEDLPHVLIVEAKKGNISPKELARFQELVRTELLDHMDG